MTLLVDDIIEIRGRKATICYTKDNYICVAFDDGKLEYDLYKYKFENEKLLVAKVTDQDEYNTYMKIFIEECIDEYRLPQALQEIFLKLGNDEKNTN